MSRAFDELKPYLDRAMALNTALVLFEWDNETLAPEQAGSLTGNVIGILSGEYFQAVNNDPANLSSLYVGQHLLKGRTVSILPTVTFVRIYFNISIYNLPFAELGLALH